MLYCWRRCPFHAEILCCKNRDGITVEQIDTVGKRADPEGENLAQDSMISESASAESGEVNMVLQTSPMPSPPTKEDLERLKTSLQTPHDATELKCFEKIGCGGFGRVYKASWRRIFVAAKVIPVSPASGLEKKLSVYRSLNHPNILSLMGIVPSSSSTTIITNLVNDGEKISVSLQVCQALVFMHTSKPPVAHLDLKPANILVESVTKRAYVGDFGLSQVLSATHAYGSTTMRAGTPGFQAPKQLRGEQLDEGCDVYAFGGILTELFGEKALWKNLSPHQIMFKLTVENTFPVIDHLPLSVQQIVKHCFTIRSQRESATGILFRICDLTLSKLYSHD